MKRHSNKGFTVMEMLIVVAVIAILIAIAIPAFNSALEKVKAATCAANRRAMLAEIKLEQMLDEDLLHTSGENSVFSALWEKCAKECTCPDGGKFTAKYDDKGFIKSVECSKHSANFGDKDLMNNIGNVAGSLKVSSMDSGALGTNGSFANDFVNKLKANGIDVNAMGAASWSYDNKNNLFYWSTQDISKIDAGSKVPVIRYNTSTGTYTVWITTLVVNNGSIGNDNVKAEYVKFGSYSAYTPSTSTDQGNQTYEQALVRYQEAMENIKANSK